MDLTVKRKEPERLAKGKAFHKEVQENWRQEAEGKVEPEKGVRKPSGRQGRIDIMVNADQEIKALVEIKDSDWDAMTDKAVRRNVRRQIRQVWGYIDSQPNDGEGVCPGIIFPRRPTDSERMKLIEELFLDEGIPVVWEDETIEERRKCD